jgi:hypothetical protein
VRVWYTLFATDTVALPQHPGSGLEGPDAAMDHK